MNKIYCVLIMLFSIVQIQAQTSFEGVLTYKIEPKNPNTKLIADSVFYNRIKKVLGGQLFTIQKYIYKKDKYKSEIITKGGKNIIQVYKPEEKKLYTWINGSDSASCVSSEEFSDKIKEVIQVKEEEEILGVKCKKLTVISTFGQTTYWYSSEKYKIDYELFITHEYGNWNEYLKIAGALPLKYEVKGNMLYLVTTAVEIKEQKISDSEFDLPIFKGIIQQ